MTHALLALGHPVTAVDNSAEMLAHVRGADTIVSEIEGLELGRRFECVLLASQLINVDEAQRRAFLETCARHVASDGAVLIQRYDPAWAADPQPSSIDRNGLRISVLDAHRDGPMLTATVEYELDGATWRHGPFSAVILEDDEIATELGLAGLRFDRWLDERHSWIAARPAP